MATPAARTFLDMRDATQVDARLQLGRPVEVLGVPGFVDGQIGFRSRGQNGDELRADLTYGLRPASWLLLLAQSFSAIAPSAATGGAFASQKFQLSGVYDATDQFSIQLGVTRALGGLNAPAEAGALSALWVRF